MSHQFHSSILRAYDIRGIYNETLFDKDAYYVAKSFASFLRKNDKKKIVVACDGRLSSPILKEELIMGLKESGLDVFDVGVGPTPMLYFSVYQLDCDAGIMVTGSHNPKTHNGFKITLKDGPFFGDDILNLADIAKKEDFISGDGTVSEIEIEDDYVEKIVSDSILNLGDSSLLDEIDKISDDSRAIKIAWDAGNGAAGRVMRKITDKLNAKNFLLFDKIDGNFPNHHPDPTVEENLIDLRKVIKDKKCDLGIAFDGDGDRIGVVDDEGEILWGDQLLAFYAREILSKTPDQTIIADVKASSVLFDEIKKYGGKPLMWKTGHSFIKAKMKEQNAPLAGEMSGHIFFKDQYLAKANQGYDDALYAAIRLINIVVKSGEKLSDLRKKLPKTFSTPEIRIEVNEEEKFGIIDKLKEKLRKQNQQFNDVDGVRMILDKGWWLIRASNTQAVLVARCEAYSQENLSELKENLKELLKFLSVKIPTEL